MERFAIIAKDRLSEIPRESGCYAFYDKAGVLLYIGKAINIQNRVKNHFFQPSYRDNLFMDKVDKVGYLETDSEIEALILEASLIKKHQPRFNVTWRDDKNYFWVAFTKDPKTMVYITHQKNSDADYVGPFVEGTPLKKTLKFLRRAFPFYSTRNHPKTKCTWCHLGLCPGPNPDLIEYKKTIKNLKLVLQGKKQAVLKSMEKNMQNLSKENNFEKAGEVRDKIFAFKKILLHSGVIEKSSTPVDWTKTEEFLKVLLNSEKPISRIEGYDVSNTQGNQATASMVVFVNGVSDKSQYKKFKIKTVEGPNDTAMLKEALSRRMAHQDWPTPDLFFIDGGKGQLNAAISVVKNIPIVSLAKRNNELFVNGREDLILLKTLPREIFNLILQIRDESHRFAITYHKKLRKEHLLTK